MINKNEEGIFYTDNNVFSNQVDPHLESEEEEFFTLCGLEDYKKDELYMITNSESKSILAKKVIRKNGTKKYLVKIDSNGKIYNPLSIYGQEQEKSFLNRVCRSNTKFVEVNQKTFDWYIKFLCSKNVAWLNNAERERE